MEFQELFVVAIVGFAVGVLSGMFGVGGGFLTVPTLNVFAGIPLPFAIGSSTCQALGAATAGMIHRLKSRNLQLQIPLTMMGGNLIGLLLGFRFLEWAKKRDDLQPVMMSCYLVLLLFLAGLFSIEWYYSRKATKKKSNRIGWLAWLAIPPMGRFEEIEQRSFSIPVLAILGIGIGFLTGGLGMGGGIILMPALIFLVGLSVQKAITATLATAWLGGIIATIGQSWNGNVQLEIVCILMAGGTIGGKLGSQIGEKIAGRRLRGYFTLVILAVAGMVAYRLWSLRSGSL